jgi:hypothetical protein
VVTDTEPVKPGSEVVRISGEEISVNTVERAINLHAV